MHRDRKEMVCCFDHEEATKEANVMGAIQENMAEKMDIYSITKSSNSQEDNKR